MQLWCECARYLGQVLIAMLPNTSLRFCQKMLNDVGLKIKRSKERLVLTQMEQVYLYVYTGVSNKLANLFPYPLNPMVWFGINYFDF